MKQKINSSLSFIALIAILTTMIALITVNYEMHQGQIRVSLRTYAELLRDSGIFADPEQRDSVIPELSEYDNLRITWINSDGEVLYDNAVEASKMTKHDNRPEIEIALRTGEGESVRKSDTFKMDTYYYALRLENGTVIRLSREAESIVGVYLSATPIILIIAAAILIICILIGNYLTNSILQPIESMAEELDDPAAMPIYPELEPFADMIRTQHDNVLAAANSRQDFTANVSHELKTPLTAITGYAELIENNMIDAEQTAYIAGQIHSSAQQLLSLINDIIRLSELDHKELPHDFVELDLYEVVKNAAESLEVNAASKGVELSCDGMSATVSADRALLRELACNLIQNAIQYNNEDGRVEVYAGWQNRRPFMRVKDNGIGIPKDQQDRIFERFYRVDKSRSRETGGTGLGLSIVKHIAELHNAKIEVNSEPGKGTDITVQF